MDGFRGHVPDEVAWLRLKRKLYRTKWVFYAKPPFADLAVIARTRNRLLVAAAGLSGLPGLRVPKPPSS